MIEDSKQTSGDAKGRSYSEQTIIQSKVHIPGPSVGVSQIPRDKEATEWGNIVISNYFVLALIPCQIWL